VAYEWTGALAEPARSQAAGKSAMPVQAMPQGEVQVQVRKPQTGGGKLDKGHQH
jgi:NOL1/NOP2/fmu family ribosome biogenesis protein